MRSTTRTALVVVSTAAILGACSPSGPRVNLLEDAFSPAEITIDVGETVAFVNDSTQSHTVTAYEDRIPDGAPYFASGGFSTEAAARDDLAEGLIDPGERYEVTFEEPGTYEYFCIPHEELGMTGTITVR